MNETNKKNPLDIIRKQMNTFIEKEAKDRKILALEKKVEELQNRIDANKIFDLPIHLSDDNEDIFIPFSVGLN